MATTTLLNFEDLKARRLFTNRMTLMRAINLHGFPPGIMVTPNRRAWFVDEVEQWLASRPIAHERSSRNRKFKAA
jgi:predicted DNA-binding transcriptional regulator AlpA